MAHLYIVECSTVQCSTAVECEVPREFLLHTNQLMPPLEIGFERFEENELDSAIIPEQPECRSTVVTLSVWIICTKQYIH